MMVAIRQTPSAGRRFHVTRRPRVLGGSLLAERYHERAVGVVVGARPLLNQGGREAEGLRADPPALRVACQHDRLAAGEPDLDRPGLDISRRLDAQATVSGVSLTEAVSAAYAGAGLGSLALAPGNIRKNEQQNRAGHAIPCGTWW